VDVTIAPTLRIESIPQTIAQEVEPKNQHGDRQTGHEREVRRIEQVGTAAVQHGAPAGRGRLDAEAKEAERRLTDDRASHSERRLHDDRRQH